MLINYCDICKRNVGNDNLNKIQGIGVNISNFNYEICAKCYKKYSENFKNDERKFKVESQRYVDHKGYGEWSKVEG